MDLLAIVKSNRLAFWLACFAVLAIFFVSEHSYYKATQSLDELGTMGQARVSIQSLERGLLDAETAQHGYLLTNRKEYLEPYEKAVQKIAEALHYLDQHYQDAPQAKTLLDQLHKLTESRLSELVLTLRLHDEGKVAAATDMLLSGIGREQMADTLALSDDLLRQESLRVIEGRENVYTTLWLSRIGLAAFCTLGIVALFVYWRKNSALFQQQLTRNGRVQSERDQLEKEVTRRTASLTHLTHHLQTAREDERRRIARDLHDELGSLLTSAKLDAARIKSRLIETDPVALELLTHLGDTLNNCIALKRRIIEGLHPSSLTHLGLAATLEIQAREFTEQTGVKVHCELSPVQLGPTAELVIYRVVQESITNLTKYAQARNVWLTLGAGNGFAHVVVRDDGVGFDPATLPRSAYGLAGMRFRVEAEGGSFAIVSTPGSGTLIRATLPESLNGQAPKN
ncbi:MAG: CHASE3 domain-containing protein [Pseudomonadota bacterium]